MCHRTLVKCSTCAQGRTSSKWPEAKHGRVNSVAGVGHACPLLHNLTLHPLGFTPTPTSHIHPVSFVPPRPRPRPPYLPSSSPTWSLNLVIIESMGGLLKEERIVSTVLYIMNTSRRCTAQTWLESNHVFDIFFRIFLKFQEILGHHSGGFGGPPTGDQNGNLSQGSCSPSMDTWPSNTPTPVQSKKNRKGKVKATLPPCPLLEGGALTSATLREDDQGRFEWVTAQDRASSTSERYSSSNSTDMTRIGRKLVCGEEAVLAFPNTRSPQPHQRATSLLKRAEHGVYILNGVLFHDLPYTI